MNHADPPALKMLLHRNKQCLLINNVMWHVLFGSQIPVIWGYLKILLLHQMWLQKLLLFVWKTNKQKRFYTPVYSVYNLAIQHHTDLFTIQFNSIQWSFNGMRKHFTLPQFTLPKPVSNHWMMYSFTIMFEVHAVSYPFQLYIVSPISFLNSFYDRGLEWLALTM